VVAKKLNWHYIGVEIEVQYCVWAEQRLELAQSSAEIQGYADGVFWERNSLPEQKAAKNQTKKKKALSSKGRKRKADSFAGSASINECDDLQKTLFDFEED